MAHAVLPFIMRSKTLTTFLVAAALTLGVAGCQASAEEASTGDSALNEKPGVTKEIKASSDPQHGMLAGLWNVRRVEGLEGLDVSIYETGGGDPAMNGNQLWLSVSKDGVPSLFDLGLDVRTVEKTALGRDGVLRISGFEDTVDDRGEIKSGTPFEAKVTIALDARRSATGVSVEGGSRQARSIKASSDKAAKFMGSVFAVNTAEAGESGHIARVYSSAPPGDPAMNGVHVFLSLMNFPDERTYDLGLDVSAVMGIEKNGGFEVRLKVAEDVEGRSQITQKPVDYVVTFTNDREGRPAEKITLKRL
jgi:hypothetical protein